MTNTPDIYHFDVVDSTQNITQMYLEKHATENFIITANYQTTGRGRRGRSWQSPPGSCLMMSFPYNIGKLNPEDIPKLSLATGVGIINALVAYNDGAQIFLKWPNDIMTNIGKLGGVLIEIFNEHAIIGIGLNINSVDDGYVGADYLDTHIAPLPPRDKLINEIYAHVMSSFQLLERNDFSKIMVTWHAHAYRLNEFITLTDGRSGIFKGLTDSGDALLD
jgi:BirA family biotin operon repressor/biotin-[acetyl-CoA-carboxylase] ligase